MFVLIITESPDLLQKLFKSHSLSKRGVQAFGSTLLPPSGKLGLPLIDPFNALYSFDFSSNLVFPGPPLVIYLDSSKDDDGGKEAMNQPLSSQRIEPLYRKAFSQLCGDSGIESSEYLRQLKSAKQTIREELMEALNLIGQEIDNSKVSLFSEWDKYCQVNNLQLEKICVKPDSVGVATISIIECCEEYKMQNIVDSGSKLEVHKLQQSEPHCEFTMPYSSMGFGDFFQRLERLYNFTKTFTDFNFVVEPYVNPHSKELDFNALVNIVGDVEKQHCTNEKTMEVADFYAYLLSSVYDNCPTKYNVIMGPGRVVLNNTDDFFDTQKTFVDRLTLNMPEIDFQPFKSKKSIKVIYHMRRHDTALKPFDGMMPISMKKRLGVERPLLDFFVCDTVLSSYLDHIGRESSEVEIVVISDGVDALLAKYDSIKASITETYEETRIVEKFAELNNELNNGISQIKNAVIVNRVLGRDADKTLESVKAIAEADFVITSSGFSIFIARIANADYVNGFQAIPLIEKGMTDLSKLFKARDSL